jgi:CheY-like chemotaxis protein
MQMQMPVTGGLEATRQILARPRAELMDVASKILLVVAHALKTFQAQQAARFHFQSITDLPVDLWLIELTF